jgi:hypothetical protein
MAADCSSRKFGMFPRSTILGTHTPTMVPTYDSLHLAITQLNANAASIPSTAGDGLLGHLVLTISTTAYTQISLNNAPYPAPPAPAPAANPGIPAAATDLSSA